MEDDDDDDYDEYEWAGQTRIRATAMLRREATGKIHLYLV